MTADAASYCVARIPAPVLNTRSFKMVFGGTDGKSLKTDRCGQVRELEFIALPGTFFTIHEEFRDGQHTIFKVETAEYPNPPGVSLYLDSRFTELRQEKPQPLSRRLVPKTDIQATLKAAIGSPYVWGGNAQNGVSELLDQYYDGNVSGPTGKRLTLAGLDCSGLLYQATGGWTPRNTSQLLSFGRAVHVAGKTLPEIAGNLEPLDLIVWKGHVIIVLDRGTVIESRLECEKPGRGGVVTTPLQQRLREILQTRRPMDQWSTAGKQRDVFVVRRWYGL
jgi:hypothetical protein